MTNNPGQENKDGKKTYLNFDPLFITNKLIQSYSSLTGVSKLNPIDFTLQTNSVLRKNKLLLTDHFQILSNTTAHCNNDPPADGLVIPDACVK
jgi:hypothetical protein